MKGKKVLPPTYLLISIVLMVALHFLHHPIMSVIPLPWNFFGIIPLVLGIVINIIADDALHKAKTTVKPFEESTALVTSSVYRISRHPMYLGFAHSGWGSHRPGITDSICRHPHFCYLDGRGLHTG